MGEGGVSVNVGFDSKKKSKGSMPKGLQQRLSQRAEKAAEKAKLARENKHVKPKVRKPQPSAAKVDSRGPKRVNPVTGKMTNAVETKVNAAGEEMVREGCMWIPKKYLTAATDAGLGSANGMYSHMSAVKRELNSGHNLGAKSNASRNTQRSNRGGPSTTLVSTGGSSRIHKLNTTSSSGFSKGSNIKQVVQGRSRSLGSSSNKPINESSWGRQKGVVNTFGGAKDVKRKPKDAKAKPSERKSGIASLASSGGRSFIKVQEKPQRPQVKKNNNQEELAGQAKTTTVVRKLGGKATASSGLSDREKRAAYFAKKFG